MFLTVFGSTRFQLQQENVDNRRGLGATRGATPSLLDLKAAMGVAEVAASKMGPAGGGGGGGRSSVRRPSISGTGGAGVTKRAGAGKKRETVSVAPKTFNFGI
jgi:hypothetical protein